jgi:hypothetical protein
MPAHLQAYAEDYVSQSFSQPRAPTGAADSLGPRPPVPDARRLDHSLGFGQQFTTDIGQVNPQAEQPNPAVNQPGYQQQPEQQQPPDPTGGTYDFIMNNEGKGKIKASLPRLNPRLNKIMLGVAGLFIIIILLSVVSSSGGKANSVQLLSVAQDQAEILHLVVGASQQPDISTSNQNFVATTDLVVSSSNNSLLTYLQKDGYKFSQQQLNFRISKTIDSEISTAETAGTFNQTFASIISSQLSSYMNDLNKAYNVTSGTHGKALLVSDYKQVKLLIKELNS